jgi:acyl-CoA synthetase (AMP-forming)/AMP-acid ligase II
VSNLALNLAATARRMPAHPATVTDAATMTYADLHAESSRFATLLQRNGIAFAKQRVAAYKYPRRIWLVDSLPTRPTGKLLRRDVTPPPEEV